MTLFILSFIAGVLTVATPCILPLLPVVVGGSIVGSAPRVNSWLRPLVITASLAVSVTVFTLLLKGTTVLLGIPQLWWQLLSGVVVVLLGLHFLLPGMWEKFAAGMGFSGKTGAALGAANRKPGMAGAIFIGAALGPVFNSCSPTYALIVAAVLPVSMAQGLLYVAAYAAGLSAALLLVAYIGQAFVQKMQLLANPKGWLRRGIGIVFIVVGLLVAFGVDKQAQQFILEQGWYDPVSGIEKLLW